jgi:predicted short-subunit dehydrogenase-like oxidoreductase (DUF2520 family)
MTHRVRIIGAGRAGTSLHRALLAAGWDAPAPAARGIDPSEVAANADLVVIATPDAAVADVAAAIPPAATRVVAHLSGSLGLAPLADHPRRAVLHPLVALPDPETGARRLVGAWFGLAAEGDPMGDEVVAALDGRAIKVAEADWPRYHAAAVIAANHLVALLGQVERVADGIGVPLAAFLDLARGSLDDVAEVGPAAALTGPVRRGDVATVARHLDALPESERAAYEALSEQAARLCP